MNMTKNFLMGIPVFMPKEFEDVPPFVPYKGSIQVAADCCGRVVWQGPAQQLHKAENPDTQIYCAVCLAKETARTGIQPGVIQLTQKEMGQ